MPIANCTINENVARIVDKLEDVVACWSQESGVSEEHMTVNFITTQAQYGREYSAMAALILPSIWSHTNIQSLQLGLARALARSLEVPISKVFVATTIVDSGHVVESGKVLDWN